MLDSATRTPMEGDMALRIDDLISKGDVLSGHRSLQKARNYEQDFCTTFGLDYANGKIAVQKQGQDLTNQIDLYIVDVILGIAYYTTNIERARNERKFYVILSVILIAAIPIFLSWLSSKPLGLQGPAVIAQITGALTAIVGLQQALGQWANANQRYAVWRSTSATLKTLWYGLQTKWPKSPGVTDATLFLDDLVAGQRSARAAIDAEQDDYFKTLGQLPIDILGTISSATTAVAGVVSGFMPGTSAILASGTGAAKRAADVAQAKAGIAKNEAIIKAQNDLVKQKTDALADATEDGKKALQAGITSARAAITEAETELVSARAALAVAEAPLT